MRGRWRQRPVWEHRKPVHSTESICPDSHLYRKEATEETLRGLTEMLLNLALDVEVVLRCSNHSPIGQASQGMWYQPV